MNQRNLDALEKCIELMEAGIPLEDCINRFPDLPIEVREILATTIDVMALREERVPAEGMIRNRTQLLSQAKLLLSSGEKHGFGTGIIRTSRKIRQNIGGLFSLRPLASRLVLVFAITALLIVFSRGLVITSAKSLPGDSLYPLKRAVEDISVYLVPNREIRQEYEYNYSHQRVEEVKQLIELGRIQRISFEGVLESVSNNNWVISGVTVELKADTTIIGGFNGSESFEPHAVIEVEGVTNAQGSVSANEIHLREYEFSGLVQEINANSWQISGVQLLITSKTQIDEGIHVGDNVTVLVRSEDNGIYALAILGEVLPAAAPTIQQLPTATATSYEDPASLINEEHQIVGTLEKIDSNYLVINGQIVYFLGNQESTIELKTGDAVSVNYRIEANGSFTAIDIEKVTEDSSLVENTLQVTVEAEHESDNQATSIVDPPSEDDKEEGTTPPENHETPEPTQEHEGTP